MQALDWLLGKPLASDEDAAQRVGVAAGVPTFGLNALGFTAYGREAALTVLILAATAESPTSSRVVLSLSANTAFADFPRLCRAIAEDGYLLHTIVSRP